MAFTGQQDAACSAIQESIYIRECLTLFRREKREPAKPKPCSLALFELAWLVSAGPSGPHLGFPCGLLCRADPRQELTETGSHDKPQAFWLLGNSHNCWSRYQFPLPFSGGSWPPLPAMGPGLGSYKQTL